jgi:hypothetical protein
MATSPNRIVVLKTRSHLNAALQPTVPTRGQFYELATCVGVKSAIHYFQLARGYSLVCGPPPSSGVLAQVGTHNSLVRSLLQHYHPDLDDRVFVPFNTTKRLSVGKQILNSGVPVWNLAEASKAHSLAASFLRDELAFKIPFASILYDSSPESWFHASSDLGYVCVDKDLKSTLLNLRKNVLDYAKAFAIAVLPSPPEQWWVSFERDTAVSTPLSPKKGRPLLQIDAAALSLSAAFSETSGGSRAVPAAPPAAVQSKPTDQRSTVDFTRDRPRYAECVQKGPLLEDLALLALRKPQKAAVIFDCNALGEREDGSFPRYAHEDQWPSVVEARKDALMVEAKRAAVRNSFVFNALGRTVEGDSIFKFCSNYAFQRDSFHVDEVTLINPTVYDDVSFMFFGDDIRKEVRHLRTTLGKRERDLEHKSESELRALFGELVKKVNKRAKKEFVGVVVTKCGEIILQESP